MKKAGICFSVFSISYSDFFRCQGTEDYRLPPDSCSLKHAVLSKFALKKKKKRGRGGNFGGKSIKFLTLPNPNLILFIFPQLLPYSNPVTYLPYNPKEFGKKSPFLYIHTTLRKRREWVEYLHCYYRQFLTPHDDLIYYISSTLSLLKKY